MLVPLKVFKHREVKPFILRREKEGAHLHGRTTDRSGWHGTSLDNALHRMEVGCNSCAMLIRKDIINVMRKQSNWGEVYNMPNDTSGTLVDPGALSMGIPEAFVIPEVEQQHCMGDQGLDIIMNLVVSAAVSTKVIRSRGILACTVALIAERLGISTRIVCGYTVKSWAGLGGHGSDFAVILKDYGVPLDIPLLAFWMISPASSRRIGFALFDSVDPMSHGHGHYGCANTAYKSNRAKQIVIDHGHLREEMSTPEAAVAEALATLRRNGVIR